MPEATQILLLVAAAEQDGDPVTVFGAAERLGASVPDLEPAEDRRLLGMSGDRLVFRHPLIRTAAYPYALGRAASGITVRAQPQLAAGEQHQCTW
ncbi:hypothetical protein [Nonomuraea sp. 160415]|uniref:hypothetical protein n=1 Tax=Nonomuraea basaltis TaxID=2495887 RepID=UPI00110C4B3A|nr:hypothetical protein EJK15_13460 [Nonomuraea basaltis]